MKLKPVIASYSGEAYSGIQRFLTEEVLEVIAAIAQQPRSRYGIPPGMLAELVEMHVLKEDGQLVRLNTAVFTQYDIESIQKAVEPMANELARLIIANGPAFQDAPPSVTIFLAGIIGYVQGIGARLSQKTEIWEWKRYTGKYAQSKVDFNENCAAYDAMGPDYLSKTVLQGGRFTAVFIGPGEGNFQSIIHTMDPSGWGQPDAGRLRRYLVDAFARLVLGEIQDEALLAAAEKAGLYEGGRPKTAVITRELLEQYAPDVQAIMEAVSSYAEQIYPDLEALLRTTASGRQGVPPANMMMNLWRYIRRLAVKKLFESGFFKGSIPPDGCVTVFYENNVELIWQVLL